MNQDLNNYLIMYLILTYTVSFGALLVLPTKIDNIAPWQKVTADAIVALIGPVFWFKFVVTALLAKDD